MVESSAAERAYRQTKEMILSGELAGGKLLSEGEIAEQLGMSRTPVREAFLRLQAEELLDLIPKRGAVVVPVPPSEAADVLDAREAIEAAAVRRLIRRPGEIAQACAELRQALEIQRAHARAGDLDAFSEADEKFHRSIVTAGKNALTARFYDSLADRQRRMSMRVVSADPSFVDLVLHQHENLIAIVESGDETAFTSALRDHLNGTHRR
ncbi:GntR family transcriptional regulator [Amycolatopsis sp. A1MSW2902]|uniref:GntR family transcriptional regulator n=1 Tax=Amycolatopsis sp. A1MSW2902 TaxID=687413 RepID=UPI00307E4BDC